MKPRPFAESNGCALSELVNDGFCRVDEILILSPHGMKVKTSLAGCSQIGEWPLVSCVIRKPQPLGNPPESGSSLYSPAAVQSVCSGVIFDLSLVLSPITIPIQTHFYFWT